MPISQQDKAILRKLAEQVAEIAALPVQKETADLWRRINSLEHVKPMVWIDEIPWWEMDINDELKLQTTDPFCHGVETELRRTLYRWQHMRADMAVEGKLYSPLVIYDTGFGISEDVDVARIDESSLVVSRDYCPQIDNEQDIEKIKFPQIRYDAGATERNYQQMVDIFGDIMPVEKRGIPGAWFAPWDELIRWWDVQKALMDLVLRPELVHVAVERLVSAYLSRLNQWEELNLLSLNNNNVRVGSGGLGYTDELPQSDLAPDHIRTIDLWGCATAQIFSDVSPEMHWEFALQYEKRWLDRFGLTYYGCCEPLHNKMEILRKIPNLRKVSMSPWVDVAKGAEELEDHYVFSRKPNPAVLAYDVWNPELARKELRDALEKTRGCVVEIIMKDISTVRYEPQRLWEWANIAREETDKFA